jgi:hypothetical protein
MRDQEMHSVSQSIWTILSKYLLSIYLIEVLLSIVIIGFRGWLLEPSRHFLGKFTSSHCHSSVSYLCQFFLSSHDLLIFLLRLCVDHYSIFTLCKLKKLKSLFFLKISVSLKFLDFCMHICTLIN